VDVNYAMMHRVRCGFRSIEVAIFVFDCIVC